MRQSLESNTLLELSITIQKVALKHRTFLWCPLQGSYRVCLFISGVLEKNRDAFSLDLIQLVDSSTNKFLKKVFHKELSSSSTKSSINPRMVITTTRSLRVSAASSFSLRRLAQPQPLTLCDVCLCLTASRRLQEAGTNSDWPVSSVSRLTDENTDCVPALFHTLP